MNKQGFLDLKVHESSKQTMDYKDDKIKNSLSLPSNQPPSITNSKQETPFYKDQNLLNENLINDHIIVSGNEKNRKRLINVCNKIAGGPSESLRPKRKVRELQNSKYDEEFVVDYSGSGHHFKYQQKKNIKFNGILSSCNSKVLKSISNNAQNLDVSQDSLVAFN